MSVSQVSSSDELGREVNTHCQYLQFTSNPETCRHHMRQLVAGAGGSDMHAATVARIIGVMVRTHTGLDDSATLQTMNATGTSLWEKDKQSEPKTWNVEVFIKVGLFPHS